MICIILIYRIIENLISMVLTNISKRKANKREAEQKANEDAEDHHATIIVDPKINASECSKCHAQFGYFYDKYSSYPNYPQFCPKCGRKFNGIDRRG